MNEEQTDELEALQAIYEDDITEISRRPPCFMVRLAKHEFLTERLQLKVTFPPEYPNDIPAIEVPMRSKIMSANQCSALVQHLEHVAKENVGIAMVFTLVDESTQWLNENITEKDAEEVTTSMENIVEEVKPASPVKFVEPKISGGRWDYIIGLVGKPSAGKSTFFNACTNLDLAKTGAHPFTTIEPNIGKAFYSIPCPCSGSDQLCDAAHGHTYCGDRHVPVLLKDVAGLVPGASEGKGRGNRFLHDLLDADVLIHIIDASGKTNEKGEETTDYDPSNDVRWLHDELHQWIYQNVYSKWDNIIKRPVKLIDMFTGYHANKSTIHTVLRNCGVNERELASIATWPDSILHDIVDNFLKVRFPMLLVLNKVDMSGAEQHIHNIKERLPSYSSIPVSARSECLLQKMSRDGTILYNQGTSMFTRTGVLKPELQAQLDEIKNVLDIYKSTNVQKALCQAVSLRPPTYAFPVSDLDTRRSIRKGHIQSHLETELLRDCILLKTGSTVEDLYTVMLHYPVQLLSGEFVRAETCDTTTGKKRPMKKDEEINHTNHLLHIMTNKKSS